MKKHIVIIPVLIALLTFSACTRTNKVSENTSAGSPEITPAPTLTATPADAPAAENIAAAPTPEPMQTEINQPVDQTVNAKTAAAQNKKTGEGKNVPQSSPASENPSNNTSVSSELKILPFPTQKPSPNPTANPPDASQALSEEEKLLNEIDSLLEEVIKTVDLLEQVEESELNSLMN